MARTVRTAVVASAVGALIASTVPGAFAAPAGSVTLLVTAKHGASVQEVVGRNGGAAGRVISRLGIGAVTVPSGQASAYLKKYGADSGVSRVEVQGSRRAASAATDPSYGDQWALPKIGWDSVHGVVSPSGTATLAVLDTGVSFSADVTQVPGWSAFGGEPTNDPNGHGTALASIAAATTDNDTGIAGVAYDGVAVMPVQVLGSDGTGTDADVIAGITWAADNGADVILMGFSDPGYSAALQSAVDYAWSKGAVLVAATGNGGSSTSTYPAGDAHVMGVSSTDSSDALASSSNYGEDAFIAAPGVGIASGSGSTSGTSASAAIVAGAAAQLKANDGASNGVIVGRLARNADVAGTVTQTGNGRVNLARAIADTGTSPVDPIGSNGAANGGPFVGPYVASGSIGTIAAWANTSNAWLASTLNSSNSAYNEGDSVPVRFTAAQSAGTTHNVVIKYDFASGTKHFVDGLTSYDRTVTSGVNICAGLTCPGSATTFAIPTDGTLPKPLPVGVFTAQNATITAATGYTTITGVRQLTLSYSVASGTGNKDVVIAFGAYLARSNEYGTGGGAAGWSGGSGKVTENTDNAGDESVGMNPGSAVLVGGSISGTVYNDLNGNGALDGGETGISGVSLSLSGSKVDTATTGATGGYTFADLDAGTYAVDYAVPSGFSNTGVKPLSGITLTVALPSVSGKDFFAQQQNAGISGTLYNDLNGNGALDAGDTGLSGATVTRSGTGTTTAVTNASGGYAFTGLTAGTYSLTLTTPTGYAATSTNPITGVVLASGSSSSTGNNFFVRRTTSTALALTTGTTPSTYGNSLTYTATVTSLSPSNPSGIGTVTFTDGATTLCSAVALTGNTATCSGTTLGVGSHSIVATYSGTSTAPGFAGSASSPLAQSITARAITVTADAKSQVYGEAGQALTYQVTSGSLAAGDTLSGALTRAAGSNVGSYGITQGTLTSANNPNYTISFVGANYVITSRPITVTAVTDSKVYDGTTTSSGTPVVSKTVVVPALTGTAIVAGDTASFSQAFASAAVGTGKTLTPSGSVSTPGFVGSNYTITFVNDTTGAITGRAITVTADPQSQVYGEAAQPLTYAITSGTLASGDTLSGTLSRAAGANVGAYAINQGTLSNANYTITFVGANYVITARPITVTAVTDSKTYDGTTSSSGTPLVTKTLGSLTGTAIVAGDSASFSQAFASAAAGTGKTLVPSGSVSTPAFVGSNYVITFVDDTTGVISKRAVTVTADAKSQVYGESAEALSYQVTAGSLAPSETLSGVLARAAGANVGTYAINRGTLTDSANPNYAITFVGANYVITARPITVTAVTDTKPYDGSTSSSGTPSVAKTVVVPALTGTTIVAGDTGSFSQAFATATVGTSKTLIPSGSVSTPGFVGSNYAITFVNDTTGEITQLAITVTADALSQVYGEASKTLTYQITSGALAPGDTLTGTLSRLPGSNVGSYAISQGTLDNADYDITFVGANYVITARPITVTAVTDSKTYDGTTSSSGTPTVAKTIVVPALTGNAIVAGDSASFSQAFATATVGTGKTLVPGGSVTTPGFVGSNYAITFVDDTTGVVSKRAVTITADAKSQVYGESAEALSYQVTAGSLATGETLSGTLARAAGSNVGTYAINRGTLTDAANPNYAITFVGANYVITARPITVTAVTDSKTYDATTSSAGSPTIAKTVVVPALTGTAIVAGDTGSFSQAFATATVGTSKTLIPSGSVSTPGFAGSNYAITFVNDTTGEITQLAITVTADALSQVYGEASKTLTYQITSGALAGSDTLGGALARAAGSNVGSYAINQGTLDNTNYDITFVAANYVITARPITVTALTDSKTYDGTTSSGGTPTVAKTVVVPALTGNAIVAGDTGSFSQAFASAAVGTGKTLIPSGSVNDGNGGANYAVTFVNNTTGVVSKRAVTITADAKSQVYGESAEALSYQVTAGSLATGETLSGTLARAAGSNVGTYAINRGTLTDAANPNYAITFVGANYVITARPITVTAVTDSKTYDGTTSSSGTPTVAKTFVLPALTGNAIVSGDTAGFSQAFDTAAVGTGKTLTPSGSVNDGNGGANYDVTFVPVSTGSITQRALTITADALSQVYGEASKTLTYQITSGALAGSDTLGGALARAAGSNVGSYAINQGTLDNPNYDITFVAANYVITARPITVTAVTDSKTYDATTSSAGSPTIAKTVVVPALTGTAIVAGDTGSFSQAFATATVGTAKTLIPSGSVSTPGFAGSNYAITFVNDTTGEITQLAITVTADALSQGYGEASKTLTYQITSGALAGSDTLGGALARAAGSNVGSYAINQGTLDNTNYDITFVAANYVITARPITVTAVTDSKTYDATTSSAGSPTIAKTVVVPALTGTAIVAGDTGSFSQAFATATVGTAKTLIPSGSVSTPGFAGSNYAITFVNDTTGEITQLAITVTADALSQGYGEASKTLTYQITSGALAGSDTLGGALARAAGSNVGSYAINQGTLDNTNYDITFVAANYVITARPITVTAVTDSKTYDATTSSAGSPTIAKTVVVPALTGTAIVAGDTGSFSQAFATATVGTAKTLIPSGSVSTPGFAGSNYAITFVNDTTGEITQLAITVTADALSQGYGEASKTLTYQITSGALAGSDTLGGALARAAGSNVGSYAINQGTLDNTNYDITFVAANYVITARPITVTAVTDSKTYDATTSSAGSPTIAKTVVVPALTGTAIVAGDTGSFSQAFATATVGTAKTLIPSGSVSTPGFAGSNYAITFVNDTTGEITQLAITVTADALSQGYGEASKTLTYQITSGALAGSDTLGGALARAAGSNVGSYAINQGTLDNTNYDITFVAANYVITARPITVTAVTDSKTYDATTSSAGSPTIAKTVVVPALTGTAIVAGDTGSFSQAFSTATVGTSKTLVSSGSVTTPGFAGSNYAITFVNDTTGVISQRAVTVTADAKSQVYGEAAEPLTYQITAGSLASGETLSGVLARAAGGNVGPHAINRGTLTDAANTNYAITFVGANYAITARPITVTAVTDSKTYDGSTSSSGTPVVTKTLASLTGTAIVAGDTASFSQAFASAAVGTGKTLVPSGSVTTPAFAGSNYAITFVNDTTGVISQRAITVTADGKSQVYGEAAKALTYQVTSGTLAPSETLSGALARAAGSNVGSYAINRGSLTDAANPNYAITFVGANYVITARPITVTAVTSSKIYDGTTSSSGTPTVANTVVSPALTGSAIVSGDTASFSQAFLTASAGTGKTLVPSGSVTTPGFVGSNYAVTFVNNTTGIITPRAITVTADNKSRIYGDPNPLLTATVANAVVGETINYTLSTTATPASFVGTYPITVTLGSNPNYTVTPYNGTLTITPRDANAAYIGQTVFTTSGSSSTTAQVTLSASVADTGDSGGSIANATATFKDLYTGKVLATGVKVTPVANTTSNTGTANTIVTLSSGQYGAQSYLIEVSIGGSYKNTQQTGAAPGTDPYNATHVNVTVMVPPTQYSTQGAGTLTKLATAAGKYGDATLASYSLGLKYNNKGTSPQGQVLLTLTRADGTYYVKSNSITSLAFATASPGQPSKDVTIYTKASIFKILNNGTTVSVDGGVTLRVDAHEGCTTSPNCSGSGGDTIGFTVLSGKDSALYYSNNWVFANDTLSWRTVQQAVTGVSGVVIN